MSRPHVLYVTPIFGYPALGGPRLRTYNTLKALARCADVSLYLTDQPDTPDRDRACAHLLTFCRDVHFPPPPPGPGVARRAIRALMPGPLRRAVRAFRATTRPWPGDPVLNNSSSATVDHERAQRAVGELRDWVYRCDPDLIWLGFGGISYDLVPLKADTGKPLVLETECVWSRFILRELPFESDPERRRQIELEGRAKEAEERSGALQADITTAVSDVDAEYFRSLAPDRERVMLLANVIDVDAYTQSTDAVALQQPAVVFAGTFSDGTANVDATIWLVDEVMPLVWRRRPDAHLYLVGRSPAPAVLARRGARVHVSGEVPAIAPYMRGSVAALVPLRWESGTRFKILEAFACKTPVVSTTLGAEGLDVRSGEHLLLADDADAFAAAVLSLLENPAMRRQLVEPAYALVRQHYDVSSAERQINAILTRLGFGAAVSA